MPGDAEQCCATPECSAVLQAQTWQSLESRRACWKLWCIWDTMGWSQEPDAYLGWAAVSGAAGTASTGPVLSVEACFSPKASWAVGCIWA